MARDPKYDVLFEPIKIGPKVLKNRFYQVPHCNGAGSDRPGSQAEHRAVKAEGGWAAVCTEACAVNPEGDFEPHTLASLYDDDDVINLRHMTDEVHRHDALAGVELWHSGGISPCYESRAVPKGVGQLMTVYTPHCAGHEMDLNDIQSCHRDFENGAKRAVDAGFDIVYSYGSHSVLPFQFLSKWYNKRTDKYGGSFENRARFWREQSERIKKAVGDHCALAIRISVDQLMGPDGLEVLDDGLRFIELLDRDGHVDLWDVNINDQFEWGEDAGPSRFFKANHQAPFVKHVKSVTKAPVLNVGRFTSPDDMVNIINSGQADIIGAARPSIADPFLPKKIDEGRLEDIRECIGCNMCISRWERGVRMVCTQNATAMEEYRRDWHPEKFKKADQPESILVVGAGPAGLECARVLGEQGHEVHLVDAEKEIGGHMRYVSQFPGLGEWWRLITYRQAQIAKLKNIELHLGQRLTAEDVLTYGADKVVLATGARWLDNGFSQVTMGAIPGIDCSTPYFATPEQVMAGKAIGQRVLVLDADGYYTAYSIADKLADEGKQVTAVSVFGQIGSWTNYTLETPFMQRTMRKKGIKQIGGTWIQDVEVSNCVQVRLFDLYRDDPSRTTVPVAGEYPRKMSNEATLMEFDTVVLVTGRVSNDGLYKELAAQKDRWKEEDIKGIYQAGDCYAPRFLADTIFAGHRIAREITSADPQTPLPYKRERMVWGRERT
ncbi:FAD-dependent oxidoreductase [Mesorhizobium sophorae]|uniref:oxidoreductase n=1 Tax=Mesorhizobium sophorae TaxID=1300294 RepID=UPI000BA3AE77|nr:FAD-dependent oxidoreductase [Mesorhizobium sophorae]